LLGVENARAGVILDATTLVCDGIEIATHTNELQRGTRVAWAVTPERIAIGPEGAYAARVIDAIELGRTRELTVKLEDLELAVRGDQLAAEVGDEVVLDIPAEHIAVWRLAL
jgi:ABC-type Fe3+/spermidine/putrescine transport system ATPase subunit